MSTLAYIIMVIISVPIVMALYVFVRLTLQGESYNSKSWYNRIKKFIGLK
jgi:hypothetical protein